MNRQSDGGASPCRFGEAVVEVVTCVPPAAAITDWRLDAAEELH